MFGPIIIDPLETYLSRMRLDGSRPGHSELFALANLYNLPINLYSAYSGVGDFLCYFKEGGVVL